MVSHFDDEVLNVMMISFLSYMYSLITASLFIKDRIEEKKKIEWTNPHSK